MIRTVIFDLDETLLDRTSTVRDLLISQFEPFRLDRYFASAETYAQAYRDLDNNGYTGREKVYRTLFEDKNVDIEAIRTDAVQRLADFVIFREGAKETLSWLQKQEYRLGIITNGDAWGQRRKLNRLGIESCFQCITISGVFGVKKPDPSIFLHTLKELGTKPEESLFVGDHPEKDIQGSLNVGMVPVWKKSAYYQPPGPDIHKIESLLELPPLVEKINS